jgi:hypothetical protein
MYTSRIAVCLAILAIFAGVQTGSAASVSQALTINDNGGMSKILTFGLDPAATNGIDTALGEAQLPPMPPAGVFDARFVGDDIPGIALGQGSWHDYRQGDQHSIGMWTHELRYQTAQGRTITVNWSFPSHISGRLQDIITGTLIDVTMAGTGSYTIANPSAFNKLKMTVSYDEALPIQLASFTATRSGATDIRLDWTTLSEVNNFGFYVQRRAADDPVYDTLPNGFVAGHGTTNTPQYYSHLDVQVGAGTWYYRLKQIDLDGTEFLSDPVQVNITTGVNEGTPLHFQLMQNYPNPFNPTTRITFMLPFRVHATLTIFDVLGKKVAVLLDESTEAGVHTLTWNAGQLVSGVYFSRLDAGTFTSVKTLFLVK